MASMSDRDVGVVNLTGHPLTLGTDAGAHTFASRGRVRAEPHMTVVERLHLFDRQTDTGIYVPLIEMVDDDLRGMPNVREPDTLYVVSGIIEQQAADSSLVSPARMHKEGGIVVYARALMRHG